MSQLEYAKLSQTDYNQEKFIPQTNPMQRPKEQPPIQQQYPTPAPFNTLLPSNTAHPPRRNQEDPIPSNSRRMSQHSVAGSLKQLPPPKATSSQEQALLDRQQQLMIEMEALNAENRRMSGYCSQLEQQNNQLQRELQLLRGQKQNQQELEAQMEELKNNIVQLKSENRRMQQQVQDDQYQLLELGRLKSQLAQMQGLERELNDANSLIQSQKQTLVDQKRQIEHLLLIEEEHGRLKESNEKLKNIIRDRDVQLEQQTQKNQLLMNDNKKMKQYMDMINDELKKQVDINAELGQKHNALQLDSQATIQGLQKQLTNLNYQNEQQKLQISQLENKEKELIKATSYIQTMDQKFRQQQQIILDLQRDNENLKNSLASGKQEFGRVNAKLQAADQENWKLKEQVNQLNNAREQLLFKCQQLEQDAVKKNFLEDTLQKSQSQFQQSQNEAKKSIDQWKTYSNALDQENQKKDLALRALEGEKAQMVQQIKQLQANEQQMKADINNMIAQFKQDQANSLAKMKEMHANLLSLDTQCQMLTKENRVLQEQGQQKEYALQRTTQVESAKQNELQKVLEERSKLLMERDLGLRETEKRSVMLQSQLSQSEREKQQLQMDNQRQRERINELENKVRMQETEISTLQFKTNLEKKLTWQENMSPTLQLQPLQFNMTKFQ